MSSEKDSDLTAAEKADFRRLAGAMVPASAEYGVPGADDELIFADIVRSLDRDTASVRRALALLREASGGSFASLDPATAEATANRFLEGGGGAIIALGRTVLQCYYRDDRVMRSIGREPRAPFPRGHDIEATDWSILDPVRAMPRMWRDVDGNGA
jgi:hypothetical protein